MFREGAGLERASTSARRTAVQKEALSFFDVEMTPGRPVL